MSRSTGCAGTGLQAIVSAAQITGDADVAGARSMSRGQYCAALRGQRNDGAVVSILVEATDPFDDCHGDHGRERGRQVELAEYVRIRTLAESHRAPRRLPPRAIKEQIVPIEVKTPKSVLAAFDMDEAPGRERRGDDEAQAGVRQWSVTAANAAGINDAAAAVGADGSRRRRTPRASGPLAQHRARAAHAGVEPKYMGIGPVPAVRAVLDRARRFSVEWISTVIEVNGGPSRLRRRPCVETSGIAGLIGRIPTAAASPRASDRRDGLHPHREGAVRRLQRTGGRRYALVDDVYRREVSRAARSTNGSD